MKGGRATIEQPSGWEGLDTPVILPTHVDGLLKRDIAFVRVPEFLSASWCQQVVRRLLDSSPPIYESYDVTLLPYADSSGAGKMLQVGFALSEAMQHSKTKDYFGRSREIYRTLRGLYSGGEDPLLKLQAMLTAEAGWNILQALEQGDPYISDMIWVMPAGIPLRLHTDRPKDMKPLQVSRYRSLLSCNAYLSVPAAGGELVLHRDPPPSAAASRGVNELRRLGAAICRPCQGDLILFNGGNFHEVLQTTGEVPRITNHSFMVFAPEDRSAIFWA